MATSPLPTLSSSATTTPAWIPRPATIARDALYLCAGLPAGIVTFSVLVTGLSLAAGLAITLVGIPVMLATLYASRLTTTNPITPRWTSSTATRWGRQPCDSPPVWS
ncbi:MAG: sensor domain-containing protein [Baekduia sp.]